MSSVTPQRSDTDEPQPRLVISADGACISKFEYLPDGRRVVTAHLEAGTVKVWNLENGKQEGTSMEHESGIYDLAVTRDGTKIISSDEDGNIKVWNVESHEILREWTHPNADIVAISPDDRLIAVAEWEENMAIYTMEGRQKYSIEVGSNVCFMSFSPDGKKLACNTSSDIRVYHVDGGTRILGPIEGHENSLNCVLWSRDGSRLFSGSSDRTIRCWNSDTGEQIGHPWTGHTDWIRSLALSPDGSILASASSDKAFRFWDATTGHPIGRHLQHDKGVCNLRFSPSGESLVSAGWDGNLYLWRVPWLNSVENRVRTLVRRTSLFILIALSILKTSLGNVDAHCAQVSLFHPHPPYSPHILGAEQVLHFDFDVSICR